MTTGAFGEDLRKEDLVRFKSYFDYSETKARCGWDRHAVFEFFERLPIYASEKRGWIWSAFGNIGS